MKKLLVIGTVWPEPNSSAAGSRMLQLLDAFQTNNWTITFASAAANSDHMADLTSLEISTTAIQLNDTSFNSFVQQLQPSAVIFDRFMTEEQFGWRVANQCPDAIRILNTEDLHCLRKTRQQCFKNKQEYSVEALLHNEITKREIASIYRCDLSLIVSDYEIELLKNTFQINPNLLCHIPFLLNPLTTKSKETWPDFEARKHFVTIGNFRHDPNWDSVLYLKKNIWPLIKKEIPEAELHIYGAYPPPKATQLNNPKEGFLIKGWTKDSKEVMRFSKVCLAPLRFGAGIKGKLAESMICGTPSVTTSIGSEGMLDEDSDWNGFITNDPNNFAKAAIKLYLNKNMWQQSQQNGIGIINTRFQKDKFQKILSDRIKTIKTDIQKHRTKNFIGSMLYYHSMRSTEFMSRWIAEKNKRD